MKVVLYGTLFLFMTSGVANAQDNEIFACMNRSGKLIVIGDADSKREECRRREVLRSWNQEGPTGPQGPEGPQGPKGDQGEPGFPATELHLFDGSGQDLGILAGSNGEGLYTTYVSSVGLLVRFKQADTDSASITAPTRTVYWLEEGCTGDAFAYQVVPQHIYNHQNGDFFFTPRPDSFQSSNRHSYSQSAGCCSGCVNSIVSVGNTWLIDEVSLPFADTPVSPLTVAPTP